MRRGYSTPDKPKRLPPPPPPAPVRTGTIRETCSCGASVSAPDTTAGRQYVLDWRTGHRHQLPSRPEPSSLGHPVHSDESTVTTGEVRDTEAQQVPFGFFPPVIEAKGGER